MAVGVHRDDVPEGTSVENVVVGRVREDTETDDGVLRPDSGMLDILRISKGKPKNESTERKR